MSQPAIVVENLGKKYKIGLKAKANQTFPEAVMDALKSPFRRLRALGEKSNGEDTIWALKDVSFKVQPGEVVGIIGRNGAGKSTLLKILSRITEPTTGRAIIHGRVGSLLEVGTGFHPELTGRENIYLNGAILGMKKVEIDRKFDEIVAFSEVEKFLDTPVKRYSSGMYVRLAFAVAAHLDPEILIVDEVLAVGDAAFQSKCLGKMKDVAGGGRTLESMLVCGSAGAGIDSVMHGPRVMFHFLLRVDPAGPTILILALAGMIAGPSGSWRELPWLAFLSAAVVTLVIFCTPGTDHNHLIDLDIAALVFLGVQLGRKRLNRLFVVAALALAAVISSVHPWWLLENPAASGDLANLEAVFQKSNMCGKPVLCEDPSLPVRFGVRPYLLDSFMFKVVSQSRPEIAAHLMKGLSERRFAAVVLLRDPETENGRQWYRHTHFGGDFVGRLLENYQRSGRCGDYLIYCPKPGDPSCCAEGGLVLHHAMEATSRAEVVVVLQLCIEPGLAVFQDSVVSPHVGRSARRPNIC